VISGYCGETVIDCVRDRTFKRHRCLFSDTWMLLRYHCNNTIVTCVDCSCEPWLPETFEPVGDIVIMCHGMVTSTQIDNTVYFANKYFVVVPTRPNIFFIVSFLCHRSHLHFYVLNHASQ